MGRLLLILALVLALVGCRMPLVAPSTGMTSLGTASHEAVPALAGRVLFVAERQTQAAMTDVAVAATVSLINTGSNQTVATTLTNAAGQFVLSFGKDFQPDPSAVYYLEAVKGLDNNRPSSNVARVRTLAKFQSGSWTTLTNGSILISRSTTALSIGAALKQGTATPVDFSALIGKLEPGATSEQDVYTPVTNLSGADFTALLNLVTTNLTADRDPVATLGYNAGTSAWVNMSSGGGSGFTVTSATPATGGAGTSVTIAGTGFSTTVASNSVTFAGKTATVTAATATSLTTTVPTGAVSGQVVVTVDGTSALGPLFTVPVTVTGFTPTAGTSGTTVTVTGSGFSTTAADNLVLFNGQRATIAGATATSLTVTVPATSTGKVAVNVKGSSGTSAGDFTYGSPFLGSLNPQVANTGAKVTLEGNFGTTATVNFPGGSSAAATVLGPNRAEVTVPAGATAGNLTVTTGGVTTNALGFRRPGYTQSVLQFQSHYPQTHYGRQMPTLGTGRYYHMAAVVGPYLYVLAGRGSAALTGVERALINADGTLGAFSTVGSLALGRERATCNVVGNYLYVIGGQDAAPFNSVERAVINPDGTLGPFSLVSGVTLNTARSSHTSIMVGSYLYVIGGYNGTPLASVERAAINPDGTIGTFSTVSGVTLAEARGYHTSAVVGGYLYIVGGYNGASMGSVERATISSNGTLSTFGTVAGVQLGTARHAHVQEIVGDRLYVFGGYGTAYLNTVEQASFDASGNLGAFTAVAGVTMRGSRGYFASARVGGQVYLIGGNGTGAWTTLEYARVNGSGNLGAFATTSTPLVSPRYEAALAIIGNYVYAIGGVGGGYQSSVERAQINAHGVPGPFALVSGVSLTAPRSYFSAAVVGHYLYVVGGYSDSGSALNSVERALIFADGTLGAFSVVSGVTLATPRYSYACAVLGDKLTLIAGRDNAGSVLNGVEQATIDASGNIASFATVAGATLGTARRDPGCVVLNDYLYVIGGGDPTGNASYTQVDRATVTSGAVGGFSGAGISLGTARTQTGLAVVGNTLYLIGGSSPPDVASSERTTIGLDATLAGFTPAAGSPLTAPRKSVDVMQIGDYVFILGGWNTTPTERAPLQ